MNKYIWVYAHGQAYLSDAGPDDFDVNSITEKDCAIYQYQITGRYKLIGHIREVKPELIPLAFPKIGQEVLLRNKNLPARIICINRTPTENATTKTLVILYKKGNAENSMSVGPEDLVEVGVSVKYEFVPVSADALQS